MIRNYCLSVDQERWVQVHAKRYGVPRELLRSLICQRGGRCAWSNIPMKFDIASLSPPTDHIAATLDHSSPGSDAAGFAVVCHYLNDTKGKLPRYLFDALRQTAEWKAAMEGMRRQFEKTPQDSLKVIETFKKDPTFDEILEAESRVKPELAANLDNNHQMILQGGQG
ncbi:MAG: hypothetical protein ACLQPD_32285 [Desulfomonilaceae bacterium]